MIRDFFHFLSSRWRAHRTLRKLRRRYPNCTFEQGLIIKGPIENLTLQNGCKIQSNVLLHLGGMEWSENQGTLEIEKNACISPNVIIYAAGPGGVRIGSNFDCGPGTKIFASHSDIINRGQHVFSPVTIGDDVILFANVVVSPGVNIGNKAVVLAGSVVTRNVPPNTVYGGTPAVLIKKLDQ